MPFIVFPLAFHKSILQLLSVRESESKLVSRLFIFEFFQGAAIALYFIASISIFVEHLPATELPKVFILSAFLLWAFGFIYSQIEHRLLTKQLIYFVLIFNGALMIVFRLLMPFQHDKIFLYIFLAAFNIFYLFNNLEFWGLVALLFDVRQSKRLFSIVSAWDGPSRMTGYGIAAIFAWITGSTGAGIENLLWIAALFMVIAIVLFIPLADSEEMKHLAPAHHHHYANAGLQQIQAALTGNKLIRSAALVSFFSFCFYLVTNFVLYGYVKKAFHSDNSLAGFFAIFLVISRGLALVIKPLFVNRLLNTLGLRKSLILSPLFLLLLCLITFFFTHGQSVKADFYMFMVMAVSVDILRSSIQSPVLLATLQPLPAHQRLRGHTIIKGLMDPFSFLATGVVLLLILAYGAELNFLLLTGLLTAATIAWLIVSFSVDGHYLNMLAAIVRKRGIEGREIDITDSDSLRFLLTKVDKGTGPEALAVLRMITASGVKDERFYISAIHHPVAEVRHAALDTIVRQQVVSAVPELTRLIASNEFADTRPQLIKTIGSLDEKYDLSGYLQDNEPETVKSAVSILMTRSDIGGRKLAEENLRARLVSKTHQDRVDALAIIGDLRLQQFAGDILAMLSQPGDQYWHYLITASGKLSDERILDRLLTLYKTSANDRNLLEALRLSGVTAISSIENFLRLESVKEKKRHDLLIAVTKIGSASAVDLLLAALIRHKADAVLIVSLLYQLNYSAKDRSELFKSRLRQLLLHCRLLNDQKSFFGSKGQTFIPVVSAIELELLSAREQSMQLFSFLYDATNIRKAKDAIEVGTRESLANAFELIEMSVPKEFSAPFIQLFEGSEFAEQRNQSVVRHKSDENISQILMDRHGGYSDWTKAILLYCCFKAQDLPDPEIIKYYQESENPMLTEVALLIANVRPQTVD